MITHGSHHWSEETATAPGQEKLLSMIERRRKAVSAHRQRRTAEPRGDNVIDITDTLQRSLRVAT